jgi:(p)ppGpp synthase/HD superfamily hydrolase
VNTATISINFCLQPVEVEAADKVSSMMADPEISEQALLGLCSERLSESELENVRRTLSYAKSLDSINASHPSMRAYFSHPLRVAKLSLQLLNQPSTEIVSMGLLHNVFEVTGCTEADLLERGFSERLASGIRLTTIDRKRQYDESYLANFYQRIQDFGDDLTLIKCVDKLDNLLAFQLFERTPEIERYMTLCEQFVVPLAGSLSFGFGTYVQQTIDYQRTAGCNNSMRTRYQQFLTDAQGTPG